MLDAARSIARDALGRDAGPMTLVATGSHHVYGNEDVIVKLVPAADHARLDREVTLAGDLPVGLAAPLLASGTAIVGGTDIRHACYRRLPGHAPGMGLPGVGEATARTWAAHAVERLHVMHRWRPPEAATRALREPLDHGGFVGAAALVATVDAIAANDPTHLVPSHVLDAVVGIAKRAPREPEIAVPVHADCHWGNWLVDDRGVVCLLDFEWARFGDPVDDWFFLARFSGPHQTRILEDIAQLTATPTDALRAACELRESCYLTSDLLVALQTREPPSSVAASLVRDLEEAVVHRRWWRARR
ncbi:MAG: Phosphotransferase enzyme family protein [Acidimicrobiales bacterium]|nr:Phosphotransferase enzyme family protein [Acidimicrobiales bacterium]